MLHTLTIYECGVYYPDDTDIPSHTELFSHRCFYSPEAMEEYARQVCSTYGEVEAEYAEQFADSVDIYNCGELVLSIKIDRHFDVEHWS